MKELAGLCSSARCARNLQVGAPDFPLVHVPNRQNLELALVQRMAASMADCARLGLWSDEDSGRPVSNDF
jgi:hypothetical protein